MRRTDRTPIDPLLEPERFFHLQQRLRRRLMATPTHNENLVPLTPAQELEQLRQQIEDFTTREAEYARREAEYA